MALARLAAIGDVHGNVALLARAIQAVRSTGPDAVVCLGDIAGSLTQTAQCGVLLAENDVLAIRGNHDRWLLEAIERRPALAASVSAETLKFFKNLPAVAQFDTSFGLVLACHGVGTNDLGHFPVTFLAPFMDRLLRLERIPRGCKVVLHGHSLEPMIRECNGVLVVSVGPLNERDASGCVIVDVRAQGPQVMRVSY